MNLFSRCDFRIRPVVVRLFCLGPSPALVVSAEPSLRPTSPRLEGITSKKVLDTGNIQNQIFPLMTALEPVVALLPLTSDPV